MAGNGLKRRLKWLLEMKNGGYRSKSVSCRRGLSLLYIQLNVVLVTIEGNFSALYPV